jgi:hypothetical protein
MTFPLADAGGDTWYKRDPLSVWFDRVAADWLARAYRNAGSWEGLYLAPPSAARRAQAAAELGIYNLGEVDRWGMDRWTRALKRATYYQHKHYGYAAEFRLADQRVSDRAATALDWQTGGLIRKTGWPQRRRQLDIRVLPAGWAADTSVLALPPSQQYTSAAGAGLRSRPAPPDRPWEPGY